MCSKGVFYAPRKINNNNNIEECDVEYEVQAWDHAAYSGSGLNTHIVQSDIRYGHTDNVVERK